MNAIREELMATALQKIARMSPADFNHRMKDAQRQIDKERRMRELAEGMKDNAVRASHKLYDLYCINCDAFISRSDKMRVIQDMHRVCCDENFYKNADLHFQTPEQLDNRKELTKIGHLRCKKCGVLWGVQARYCKTPVPILQAKCFVSVDKVTKDRDVYKKWKEVPFGREAIDEEGLQEVWRSARKLRNIGDKIAEQCEVLDLE